MGHARSAALNRPSLRVEYERVRKVVVPPVRLFTSCTDPRRGNVYLPISLAIDREDHVRGRSGVQLPQLVYELIDCHDFSLETRSDSHSDCTMKHVTD